MIKELKQEAQNLSVLFIEDDYGFLSAQKELLESFFAKVEIVSNSEDGLFKYRESGRFDIVIIDLTMQKMNTLALCANIKAQSSSQYILALFANSDTAKLISAIDIGVDSFLLKPVSSAIFFDRLLKISQIINGSLAKEMVGELERTLIKQSRAASMGEMLGVIAHQLKQPLNAINLLALNIKKFSEPSDENINKNAKSIMQQVSFMSSTIDSFANFLKPSKISRKFSLKGSIDDVLTIMSAILNVKNITVLQNIDEAVCLFGHQKEFSQAMLNIISNAVDAFSNKSGQKEVLIESCIVGSKLLLSVEDNAGGVREDVLSRIFEPYVTTKGDGGTGLGLNIAKKIVEEYFGGTINVCNTNKGAKFVIELQSQEPTASFSYRQ